MDKVLTLIAVTFIYSYEELKALFLNLVYKFFRNKKYYYSRSDKIISDAVLLAAVPIAMTWYLRGAAGLEKNLLVLLLQLSAIFAVLSVLRFVVKNFRIPEPVITYAQSIMTLGAATGKLVAQPARMLQLDSAERLKFFSKFIFAIVMSTLAVLLLERLIKIYVPANLSNEYALLLLVLAAALFLQSAIPHLENILFHPKIKFSGYLRIIAGILLAAYLVVK
ncbi:MAG TPA: hypothetical protein VFX17_04145 [Patescibacteria group bacterium]|nr:hypothetical protein [Patescibacteria group bacterium]